MKIVLFYHSLVSDWNHGNAHFLRGIVAELMTRGHDVQVYEPLDGWSLGNLRRDQGEAAVVDFLTAHPSLRSQFYDPAKLDLEAVLEQADLVIVHEWNTHELVQNVGTHHAKTRHYKLLFHDTHHRAISAPAEMAAYDLAHYDGVLAYGRILRDTYLDQGWTRRAWTWHEAADTRVFKPLEREKTGDLVWIGNWGDDERTAELKEFLIEPVAELRLRATVHGVRYPNFAIRALADAHVKYSGWMANHRAPEVFARHRVTVHVPRRPYREILRGIPTIRPFEALACGIPMISAPWDDVENLFTPGEDFLVAQDGAEMRAHLRKIVNEPAFAAGLAKRGLQTILGSHTCAHRVDELFQIVGEI